MDRRHFIRTALLAGALPAAGVRPAVAATPSLKFRELYVRGNELTDKAKALEGKPVEMIGYMAPPLKPEIDFLCSPSCRCPPARSARAKRSGLMTWCWR